MNQYILSKRAVRDIQAIGEYTERNWNSRQAITYLKGLDTTLQDIAKAPDTLARRREDLKSGFYSALYKSHVIFFKKQDENIFVIRVLHQKRDIPQQIK